MYSLKISKNLYFYYIKSKGLSCLITQPHFWDGYAGNYTKTLNESGINISTAAVRAMLKVSFYTSLNGGNPFNAERMSANLKINAPDLIIPYNSISEFERSNTYSTVRKVCSNLEIISDVQRLNKSCFVDKRTYTIDRRKPYIIDSPHKGISRVLQGVEVVLLATLISFVEQRGGLPVNLAHDGALVMFRGGEEPQDICYALSQDMKQWSRFLLGDLEIGIETKFSAKNGVII